MQPLTLYMQIMRKFTSTIWFKNANNKGENADNKIRSIWWHQLGELCLEKGVEGNATKC
jgi:hypothetical protein